LLSAAPFSLTTFAAGEAEQVGAPFDGYIVKTRDTGIMRMSSLNCDVPAAGSGFRVVENMDALKSIDPDTIEWIEPNYIVTLFDFPADPPNDPFFAANEYNAAGQWNLNAINASAAWNACLDGTGVKIAVIDSGIISGHGDMNSDNILPGFNYTGSVVTSDTTDSTGHGSFISGLIAAQTNNGKGIAGIAGNAEILPLKAFSSNTTTLDKILSGIYKAIDEGCDVINMSFGMPACSEPLDSALRSAASAGIILVAAAGNEGTAELIYPAAFEYVIGVGSVNTDQIVSSFSQRNSSVFVTAPGENLTSLWHTSNVPHGFAGIIAVKPTISYIIQGRKGFIPISVLIFAGSSGHRAYVKDMF